MKATRILSASLGLAIGVSAAVLTSIHQSTSVSGSTLQRASDAGSGPDVPSPDYWVPFSAKVRSVDTAGGSSRVRMEGVFFRSRDGSDRFDSGPEHGPIKVITIHNIAEEKYYVFGPAGWRSHPMRLPPDGYSPKRRRVDQIGLEEASELVAGFRVYKYTDRGGVVSLKAPDLNFFSLRTSYSVTVQDFYDVTIGEQVQTLFSPPENAKVDERSDFAGMVWTSKPGQRQ